MVQADFSPAPFDFMNRFFHTPLLLALLCGCAADPAAGQQALQKAPTPQSSIQHGLDLAEKGHCAEALPILKKASAASSDKNLKRRMGLATVRCAMSLNQPDAAVAALQMLNREFPRDPDVLYVTIHAYSDLATRASQQLATIAPTSYQAEQLDAESLEMQGKWDEAEAEYRKILQQNPQVAGIHYRIGRIILSQPPTPTTPADAKREFDAELEIDPDNAGAEYVLGELARQAQQWDEAIAHFSRATELDAGFAEAFLGYGMSFNSAQKFSDAIPPLEKYAQMRPKDPAGHYQLAIAYARSGRKEDASREMAIQRDLDEKARQAQRGQDPNSPQ
jgi:tetratricopeptide (TPR) repeat protein